MIRHIWSVLCRESVVNQGDNILSLHNVLEELKVTLTPVKPSEEKLPEKIAVPLEYEVTSMWFNTKKGTQANAQIEYSLINPSHKEIKKTVVNMEIKPQHNRNRSRMKISGFPFEGEGVYYVKVRIKDERKSYFETVAMIPLEVKLKIEKSPTSN